MPYLMGGFPDVETSVAIAFAYADDGADLVELGVPFSRPARRRPRDPRRGDARARGGRERARGLEAGARIAEHVPVVLMCYANPLFARGPERFAAELADAASAG